ncbi:MAG TPA: DUF2339 domain-containing protein [Candidatus Acidoferrum sp.]|nr:DUF2339 domain-containing protein [Candidatus Acidoferrum sp.]
MELLAVFAIILIIITPILAISAFVRVQHLAEQLRGGSLLSMGDRLSALERRLASIEKSLSARESERAHEPKPVTAPPAPTAASTPSPLPSGTPASQVPSQLPPPLPIPPLSHLREVPAPPPVNVFAAPPLHSSKPKSSSNLDLETLIGGRWLNRIGIVAIISAVTFFLKYAFDNNWIGPSGRVAIGVLLGAAMLPWSQWLLNRGYSYFSEGIAGLGAAVMYLSIWAGCQYYKLFSLDMGFFAMIIVTAGMGAVALGRNSQRIALLSLFGGFLTPILVSEGKDAQIVLFTYLLILGAGLLFIELRRDWRSLTPISFLLSQFYFWGWYSEFYRPDKLERTVIFATLFFLLYAALPVIRAVRFSGLRELDVLVVVANSFAYLGALYLMLWPQDRWPLTLLVLALSAGQVLVARLVPPPKPGESPLTRLLFAGLALTFATLAIPIRLDGKWITLAFAIEGAILVWTGFRSMAGYLRAGGYFLIALSAIRLLIFPLPAAQFLFNQRFAAYAVLILCFGVILYAAREKSSSVSGEELSALGVFAVSINVFALIALSLELWDHFGSHAGLGIDSGLAQHLALSLLWTAYASGLIALGVSRESALLRWQALILFGLVVVKVFIYDSSFLERFYRIVSFFILGLVLLTVSFLYQRKVARERSTS